MQVQRSPFLCQKAKERIDDITQSAEEAILTTKTIFSTSCRNVTINGVQYHEDVHRKSTNGGIKDNYLIQNHI